MVTRISRGMVCKAATIRAIVPTSPSSSLLGIDHIWHCSRFFSSLHLQSVRRLMDTLANPLGLGSDIGQHVSNITASNLPSSSKDLSNALLGLDNQPFHASFHQSASDDGQYPRGDAHACQPAVQLHLPPTAFSRRFPPKRLCTLARDAKHLTVQGWNRRC